MANKTATIVGAYSELKSELKHAIESVSNCKDIDEVAMHVKNGVEAYQACMDRVNKVQEMVAQLQQDATAQG